MADDKPQSRHVDRRTLLRGIGAAATAASTSLTGCISLLFTGGGKGRTGGAPISFASRRKRIQRNDATVVVRNSTELIKAIQTPNAVVWIPENVTIRLNGLGSYGIARGVTIASNRNLGGKGGLIRVPKFLTRTFIVPEGGARLTGVRFQGPHSGYLNPSDIDPYTACGIHFQGTSGVVDNCEIFGWTGFGVGFGTNATLTQGWVHHNDMHHFQMEGLGYPIETFNGVQLIEWNYFSQYRHVVSGYGWKTNGYEARFNVVGPPAPTAVHFAFDMHRLGEQDNVASSNNTGGKYLNIHHNVFEITSDSAVSNQGRPVRYTRVANNWTAATQDGSSNEEVFYVAYPAKARIHGNHFQAAKQGRKWLRRMTAQLPLSNGIPSLSKWVPSMTGARQRSQQQKSGHQQKNGRRQTTTNGSTQRSDGTDTRRR
jgi:hypothetical protein